MLSHLVDVRVESTMGGGYFLDDVYHILMFAEVNIEMFLNHGNSSDVFISGRAQDRDIVEFGHGRVKNQYKM